MKRVLGLLVVVVLVGWHAQAGAQITISKPNYEPVTEFSNDDFAWSLEKGAGVIAGQGYLKTEGGFIQTAVGEEVALIPKTAYTDEIVNTTRTDGFFEQYTNVNKHIDYNQYRRQQTADEKGRFRFEGLAAGTYYIVTRVIWYTRDQNSKVSLHGGLLWGQIQIGDGEVRENVKLNSITEIAN